MTAPKDARTFHCPTCKGMLLFSPSQEGLRCTHCRTVLRPEKSALRIVEHDLFASLEAMPRGLDLPRAGAAAGTTKSDGDQAAGDGQKSLRCKECGATVAFPGRIVATVCSFCRSPSVLPQSQNRQLIRPESVVRFKVDGKVAQRAIAQWVRGLWFRPSDLQRMGRTQRLVGIYVPYYTYDAHVESAWTAEAGYDYTETETYEERENGETVQKTREVTKTRWESASGARADDYDDILICASGGVPRELMGQVENFDTRALVPYSPDYLAGFLAEESAIDVRQGWSRAESWIRFSQESRCGSDVPGDRHRNLQVDSQLSRMTFKHVLLPLWVAAYRYRDRTYHVLINGQTGRVEGEAPYSVAKIVLFVLLIAALLVAAYVLLQTMPGGDVPTLRDG